MVQHLPPVTTPGQGELGDDAAVLGYVAEIHPWGLATCIDLVGCSPALIGSEAHIRAIVDALCEFISMRQFGPCTVVRFGDDPAVTGFSMTQLIQTSLISGHFAEASQSAFLDIFSCAPYPPYAAARFAQDFFQARAAMVAITVRGVVARTDSVPPRSRAGLRQERQS